MSSKYVINHIIQVEEKLALVSKKINIYDMEINKNTQEECSNPILNFFID